jgi:hypothetical protein
MWLYVIGKVLMNKLSQFDTWLSNEYQKKQKNKNYAVYNLQYERKQEKYIQAKIMIKQ